MKRFHFLRYQESQKGEDEANDEGTAGIGKGDIREGANETRGRSWTSLCRRLGITEHMQVTY
jgi:hypothetical protein